jgi:serum/glucocorticoid-regulated kinase 2
MKAIEKKKIIEHKLEENTVLERNVLKQSKHPFIVELKYSFQTSSKIYFVMELVQGGEFYKIL